MILLLILTVLIVLLGMMYTCDKHTLVDTKYEIPMQRISANEQCKQKRLTFDNYNDENRKKQLKHIGIPWSNRKRGLVCWNGQLVVKWTVLESWWGSVETPRRRGEFHGKESWNDKTRGAKRLSVENVPGSTSFTPLNFGPKRMDLVYDGWSRNQSS